MIFSNKFNDRTVVFVGHSSRMDGAERSYIENCIAMKSSGFKVLAVLPNEGLLTDQLRLLEIEYIIFEFPRWLKKDSINLIQTIKLNLWIQKLSNRFKELIFDYNPGAIITNTIVISPFAALAARKLRIPHFWYIREFGDLDHGLKFLLGRNRSLKIIESLSQKVIVNSKYTHDFFVKNIKQEKLTIMYNGLFMNINSPKEFPLMRSNGTIDFLMMGRMFEKKGQFEALQAAKILKSKNFDFTLTFVGGGTDEFKDRMRNFVTDNRLEENVNIVGYTKNPFDYYGKSDIVLMCSEREAFGRVTAEAMLFGKPVIGANKGGTIELIGNDERGLLYEKGNVEELADKMIRLGSNTKMRYTFGKAAFVFANENFSIKKHQENWIELLDKYV